MQQASTSSNEGLKKKKGIQGANKPTAIFVLAYTLAAFWSCRLHIEETIHYEHHMKLSIPNTFNTKS